MAQISPKPSSKKSEPISFRMEPELSAALDDAANFEHRKRGELARLLFEWAFVKYQAAGSYDALIGRKAIAARTKP